MLFKGENSVDVIYDITSSCVMTLVNRFVSNLVRYAKHHNTLQLNSSLNDLDVHSLLQENICSHSVVKLLEIAKMFATVDYVW